ncbi:exodeoxyribonuclease I [Sarracenia purpurea var. burkii]
MGIYDNIRTHGVVVKVRVADHEAVVELGLAELRSEIRTPTVVGLGIHLANNEEPRLLQLCAGNRCLFIQLSCMGSPFPSCLCDFLADQNICFVGYEIEAGLKELRRNGIIRCGGVEISQLVARVLKRPFHGVPFEPPKAIHVLGAEVGVSLHQKPEGINKVSLFSVQVFSREEISNLLHDVFGSYWIGLKLLNSI